MIKLTTGGYAWTDEVAWNNGKGEKGDIICTTTTSYPTKDTVFYFCDDGKGGACGAQGYTKTVGDPKTVHNGTETQFFLKDNEPKAVLKQGTLTLFYHVANPLDAAHHTGADWITSVGVAVEGAPSKYVNVSIIADPLSLLQPDLALKPAPLPGAPLSTMIVSVGGEPLVAGVHTVEPMKIKATFDPGYKRVGLGYSERGDIITATFHIRVTSAAAKKFDDKAMQVKALHLDVEFFVFDKTAAHGVLPELWGLVPISDDTKKLLMPQ